MPPNAKVKPLMDSLDAARKAKADADASLKLSNDLVAAVEAKLQQLQDRFMEASVGMSAYGGKLCTSSSESKQAARTKCNATILNVPNSILNAPFYSIVGLLGATSVFLSNVQNLHTAFYDGMSTSNHKRDYLDFFM